MIILISQNLTEIESFSLEKHLIAEIGRKDLGTGPLINLTDGGQGFSGKRGGFKKGTEPWNKGKKEIRDKVLNKQSESHKNKTASIETRTKMSESKKSKNHVLYDVECPHCNKVGGIQAMKRWHFDNCKLLKIL